MFSCNFLRTFRALSHLVVVRSLMGSTSAGNRTLCMDTKHIFSNILNSWIFPFACKIVFQNYSRKKIFYAIWMVRGSASFIKRLSKRQLASYSGRDSVWQSSPNLWRSFVAMINSLDQEIISPYRINSLSNRQVMMRWKEKYNMEEFESPLSSSVKETYMRSV